MNAQISLKRYYFSSSIGRRKYREHVSTYPAAHSLVYDNSPIWYPVVRDWERRLATAIRFSASATDTIEQHELWEWEA